MYRLREEVEAALARLADEAVLRENDIAGRGDFAALPTWFPPVFAHAGFVGMMTNLVLAALTVPLDTAVDPSAVVVAGTDSFENANRISIN